MEQTELLWEYQQADMAADAYETEIKRSPKRLSLKKKRDYLVEQQNAVKKMEQEVSEMTDRVDLVKGAMNRAEEQLSALQTRLENNPPQDLTEAQALTKDMQKLLETLTEYEHQLTRIRKDTDERDKAEKEIRMNFAKNKAEFNAEKEAYDAEYQEQTAVLKQKRDLAEEKAKLVDPALLEKYAAIKKHCIPPVARLYGNQCGGCNMSLPQVTLRKFKNDAPYIECENCGRLIIQ